MPERNVDKIKSLEHELGRCRKKIADDGKEIVRLRELLEQAGEENRATHMAANALLARVALQFGQAEADPDAPDVMLGWSLTIPAYDAAETVARYEVHARRDERGDYVIGVAEREETGRDPRNGREPFRGKRTL